MAGFFLVKNELYDISLLDKDKDTYEKYKSETFYKERWIKEDGLGKP